MMAMYANQKQPLQMEPGSGANNNFRQLDRTRFHDGMKGSMQK